MNSQPLRPGAVCRYRTRPGEEESRLTVLKLDPSGPGTVYSVSLSGLKLQNPHLPGGMQGHMEHLPFYMGALENSGVEVIEHGEPPELPPGYAQWRDAVSTGRAGAFTVTVAEVLDMVEQNFARQRGDA